MSFAFVFPGQGSQSVGMLAPLAAAEPLVQETFAEASEVLGYDLWKLCQGGPEDELGKTERTQPAMLAAGVATWRVWRKHGGRMPAAMAGHSLGEYSALVAAGSLEFADALRLVELRGQLMQGAVPEGQGGMVAVVGLDDAGVEKLCASYTGGLVLEPVNYNAPGQVVVAGQADALKWLEANAKGAGARMVVRLPVSVPSHCSLMKAAALQLSGRLTQVDFKAPAVPVLHNLDAAPREQAVALRSALREQLYKPVRWAQTVQALARDGVGAFFECGPGKVLAGLNKRILDKGVTSVALEEPAGIEQALAKVKEGS
jgi:[acyl-carrier-protein] S-malonyltransferase